MDEESSGQDNSAKEEREAAVKYVEEFFGFRPLQPENETFRQGLDRAAREEQKLYREKTKKLLDEEGMEGVASTLITCGFEKSVVNEVIDRFEKLDKHLSVGEFLQARRERLEKDIAFRRQMIQPHAYSSEEEQALTGHLKEDLEQANRFVSLWNQPGSDVGPVNDYFEHRQDKILENTANSLYLLQNPSSEAVVIDDAGKPVENDPKLEILPFVRECQMYLQTGNLLEETRRRMETGENP